MAQPQEPKLVWIRPASPPPLYSPTSLENLGWNLTPDQEWDPDMPGLLQQYDSDEDDSSEDEIPKAGFKYKKVCDKVRPVNRQIPEHQKPRRQFPEDPLLNLPYLPFHPPNFVPSSKITNERMEELAIDQHEDLWPEERKLLQYVLLLNERSIAFEESERGTFRSDYFSDYIIPVIEHEPWIEKNIPLPQGHKEEIISLLKEKIKAGVYERAHTAYRSKWFCVKKKEGGLRIVHDLQKLNGVTIRDSAVPPIIEEFVEEYAGRSVYTVLDMFWGFHARVLDVHSRDLTAFQTPLGPFRLTSLPMGYCNSPAEFQSTMMFLLQDEIPEVAGVFIDDIPIKGPPTCYLRPDGTEDTLVKNPGIRRYIWEHLHDVHRILHRIGEAGGTVSAKKMQICKKDVKILGHHCSSKGREPVDERTQKIMNWPTPINLKEVRGFLGLCGTVRIWIQDYSQISAPLTYLTKKGVPFSWGPEQEQAFIQLKKRVSSTPALRPIDYRCGRPITMAVDTSIHGIGFILYQEDEQGRRVPARYGSLPLRINAEHYGQSKLELYGLMKALERFRAYIAGIPDLTVEVDAASIEGMLEHPDVHPSAIINRWISKIKFFDCHIIHVPGAKHIGPDALSRRRFTSEDEGSTDTDPEEWEDADWRQRLKPPEEAKEETPPKEFMYASSNSSESTLSEDSLETPPNNSDQDIFISLPSPQQPLLLPFPFPKMEDVAFSDSEHRTVYAAIALHAKSEEDLTHILRYLVTQEMPDFDSEKEQKQFKNRASQFFLQGAHMYRHQPGHPPQVVIFPKDRRKEILCEMHEESGHHGIWAVEQQTALRYYWPGMRDQIKHHVRSCHTCQVRSTKKMHIPITISHPPCLFSKVYLDVMKMPLARGKQWLIGCRDDLSGVTECEAIARDQAKIIARFFLERIILRYGIVLEVVTDNGPSFCKEFADLLKSFGIRHIKISPYNSQANGVVERGHYNIREALVKMCNGDLSQWPLLVPAATYADRITIRRATGFSPYYLLHGVHPLMPGDLSDATFLVTDFRPGMTTTELIAARTRQLLRLPEDVARARNILKKSRFRSKEAYENKFARRLRLESYQSGALVLIRNSPIENSVSIERKTANRYMGPYRIVRQTQGGSYILEEMDGSLLRHHVAAYRLIPYVLRQDLDAWATELDIDSDRGSNSDPSENGDQESDTSSPSVTSAI